MGRGGYRRGTHGERRVWEGDTWGGEGIGGGHMGRGGYRRGTHGERNICGGAHTGRI